MTIFHVSFFPLLLNEIEDHLLADRVDGVPVEFATDDVFIYIQLYILLYILLYADDTVIQSDSAEILKYCSEWKLQINNTKTKVGARKTNLFSFKLGNTKLEIVDNYKYLGTVYSSTRSFLKARKHVTEQARKLCISYR